MTEQQKYKLNDLMRKIIKEKYKNNRSAFARAVGVSKQAALAYYWNKRQLGWRLFYKIIEKTGYNFKIEVFEK